MVFDAMSLSHLGIIMIYSPVAVLATSDHLGRTGNTCITHVSIEPMAWIPILVAARQFYHTFGIPFPAPRVCD